MRKTGIMVFLLVAASTFAQTGGTYQIEKSVVASGQVMSGGSYTLTATAGQTVAGPRQTGVRYLVNTGFWAPDLVPTAAFVSVSGRVTPKGRGLSNAVVMMTDAAGNTRAARTRSFGFYKFHGVEVGQTYIFEVRSKRYQFAGQAVSVLDQISDLDFTAIGQL